MTDRVPLPATEKDDYRGTDIMSVEQTRRLEAAAFGRNHDNMRLDPLHTINVWRARGENVVWWDRSEACAWWAHPCNGDVEVTRLPLGPWRITNSDDGRNVTTVTPSLSCSTCGTHGFWTDGAWR